MEKIIQATTVFILLLLLLLLAKVQSCSMNNNHVRDPDTIFSSPCSQKYFSASCIEKHDSLMDFDFQGFLAHQFPLCLWNAQPHNLNFIPIFSVLQRHLIGEGSHRYLSTFIKLSIQSESALELPAHLCQAVIVESLPSGVFADPFALQHLVQRGVFSDAAVFGDTNLELPSALSNRSIVEVHIDIGENVLSGNNKGVEFNMNLPLHARYPPLSRTGYSSVEMGVPDILVRCSAKEKLQHNNCCFWTGITKMMDPNASAVVWRIPCGNKNNSGVVSAVTLISALVSTLLIVSSAFHSPGVHFTKSS